VHLIFLSDGGDPNVAGLGTTYPPPGGPAVLNEGLLSLIAFELRRPLIVFTTTMQLSEIVGGCCSYCIKPFPRKCKTPQQG